MATRTLQLRWISYGLYHHWRDVVEPGDVTSLRGGALPTPHAERIR